VAAVRSARDQGSGNARGRLDEGPLLNRGLGYDRAMGNRSGPEEGATRFAADGTLEVYDGTSWEAYQPLADEGDGVILKGAAPEDPAADDPATGHP
jgi:hypothetical protein